MTTISIEWDDVVDNILLWRFQHHWEILDYYKGLDRSTELVSSRSECVDIIVDMPSFYIPPSNIYNLVKMGVRQRPPNLGLVVFITRSMFWHRVYEIVSGLFDQYRIKLVFATSIEEARTIIQKAHVSQTD